MVKNDEKWDSELRHLSGFTWGFRVQCLDTCLHDNVTTTFPEQPTVSCLQGVIRYDNLLGAIDRVLFTRRDSLRQPSRSNRPCLVYKALFTTTFPEQSTVSCLQGAIHYNFPGAIDHVLFTLQGVIHYDNLPGAIDRVLFTRRYSLRQPSRSSRPCLVYKAWFTTTAFPEQSTVSCLQGVIHYNLLGAA